MSRPCVGFAKIAGGAPSSARKIGEHLRNQTMPLEHQKLAVYYGKGQELSSDHLAIIHELHPAVADGLRIDRSVPLTGAQIDALLAGRCADGSTIENKSYAVTRDLGINPKTGEHKISQPIGSYDFVPTCHKSVSVAFALAPPAEQAMILNAHLDANRVAVGIIKREIGVCRQGKGGEDGQVPGHVAVLEFTHLTARQTMDAQGNPVPGDPELHTHNTCVNAVFAEDGKVGSLHTAKVRGLIFEAGAVYNATLAQNLRDAGYDARLDPKTNTCVLPAVPEHISKLFSKVHEGIEQIAKGGGDLDALSEAQRRDQMNLAARLRKEIGKGGKDDAANFESWRLQAERAGWAPPDSFISKSLRHELTHEQRIERAYEVALPLLEETLQHKSVMSAWEVRSAAAIGLIDAGIKDERDVGAVTKLMWQRGVSQYGERTALAYVDNGHEVKITTALHESQEREFIALAKDAASDRSGAVPRELLDKHIQQSGLDFSDEHGRAQLTMLRRLATDGKFTIGIGAGGLGKSVILRPIISALHEQGRSVYGTGIAHRHTDDLVDAGIPQERVVALSGPEPLGNTFIEAAKAGRIPLDSKSVVIVEEVGMLGTRQGLEVLRLREKHGFTVLAVGDDRQCEGVEAGGIVDLTRKALGPERVPEILTTKRQQREAEIKFAGLMRDRRAKEAIDLKRAAGDAIMELGDRNAVIGRIVKQWREWTDETGQSPLVAAPTNRDAHDVALGIREERRKMGQVGRDARTFDAMGQPGQEYRLPLAVGDRVRMFKKVAASFPDGGGGKFGKNGAVLEVLDLDRKGMRVRDHRGKEARIAWEAVTHKSGRLHLDYGDCSTVDSAQGRTTNDFIFALPSGSGSLSGGKAYSAGTRHRLRSRIITSDVAETASVRASRPLYDERPVTLDDKWGAVGRQFAQETKKELAIDILDGFAKVRRGMVMGFARQMQPAEARQRAGQEPSHAPEKAIRLHYGTTLRPAIQQAMSLAHSLRERVGHHLSQRAPELRQRQSQGPRMSM